MIYHVYTVNVANGNMQAMMVWSQKLVDHLKKHGKELQVLRNIGGSTSEVHFLIAHETLAAFEEFVKELEGNAEEFAALASEGTALWSRSSESFYRRAL